MSHKSKQGQVAVRQQRAVGKNRQAKTTDEEKGTAFAVPSSRVVQLPEPVRSLRSLTLSFPSEYPLPDPSVCPQPPGLATIRVTALSPSWRCPLSRPVVSLSSLLRGHPDQALTHPGSVLPRPAGHPFCVLQMLIRSILYPSRIRPSFLGNRQSVRCCFPMAFILSRWRRGTRRRLLNVFLIDLNKR
jgi:hypothetical protein